MTSTKNEPAVRTRAVNSVTAGRTKTLKPAGTKVKATTKPATARVTRPQMAVRPAEAAEAVKPKKTEKKIEKTEEKPKGLKRFSLRRSEKKTEKKPKLGEVEDWSNRFVNTDVPKRPLAKATEANRMKPETARAASQAGQAKRMSSPATKVSRPATGVNRRSNFVYPQGIEKRPLSNANIYGKKPIATKPMSKEEPKGPVTIISKPDKQSHVGVIVAVILTIILGAAAGTVAFLILPK